MSNNCKSQALQAMGLAIVLAITLFVVTPTTMYIGNINEFTIPLTTILASYLVPMVILIAVLTLMGAGLNASNYPRFLVLLATVSILLWFQSNFLVWEYGLLDGTPIDWSKFLWRGLLDLGIWAAAIALAMVFFRRLAKPVVYAAVALCVMEVGFCLFIALQSADQLAKKSDSNVSSSTLKELYRFSKDRNVLHILLDGFQSDVFEQIINEGEEGEDFKSHLNGFVFFREHVGAFPLTQMTIPAFLSGKIYQNHIPINQFLDEAIGGNTFINAAYDGGYEVDIAASRSLLGLYARGKSTNAYVVPTIADATYATDQSAILIDLALFRVVPHFLKKSIYNEQLWFVQSFFDREKHKKLFFFVHNEFLRDVTANLTADRTEPVYKLFHLLLSHKPMVADENCQYAGRLLPTSRPNVVTQARCSLRNVTRLLDKMKEAGIYKQSTIILMADHGVFVTPIGLKPHVDQNGGSYLMNPAIVALALPMLAIKREGETGPITVSSAPAAITDIPATVASLLKLDATLHGTSVFDLPRSQSRERRFHVYQAAPGQYGSAEYLTPIDERIINGSPYKSESWSAGRRFLPGGVVEDR